MTPQMGGNLAFHRRQPVRPCPDETVCSERFGVCIRKTCYRTEQEDRVSYRITLHLTVFSSIWNENWSKGIFLAGTAFWWMPDHCFWLEIRKERERGSFRFYRLKEWHFLERKSQSYSFLNVMKSITLHQPFNSRNSSMSRFSFQTFDSPILCLTFYS